MYLNLNNSAKLITSVINVLVIGFLFITPSKAQNKNYVDLQTYTIQSLDGISQKISIMLDYDDRLKISCLKDTFCICRSYGVEQPPVVLNKNFLEIIYGYKAGSDITERNVIFICVNRNKLYSPLHVNCLSSWDITQVWDKRADSLKLFDEHAIYEIKLKLIGENKNEYKLIVNTHDANVSKHDPSNNYDRDSKTVLNFDLHENIFYNDYRNIDEVFTVYDPYTGSEHEQRIEGIFPVVTLGKNEYYYVNDEWFGKGESNSGNNLYKYASKLK